MPRQTIQYHVYATEETRVIVAEVQYDQPDEQMEEYRGQSRLRRATVRIAYDDTYGVASPAKRDTLTIDGENWDIVDWGEKYGGHWIMECRRSLTVTHSPAAFQRDRGI